MQKIDEQVLLTENFDVHQDWEIPIPGFYIIASKDLSKKSIADFNDDQLNELIFTIKKVRLAMKEALKIEHVYFFQNEDTEHSFHIWMFPRLVWMKDFGIKIQSVRPIMEHAKQNMMTEEILKDIREAAEKMRAILKS